MKRISGIQMRRMGRRLSSLVLAVVMVFSILPSYAITVDAASPTYTVSSSYKSSTYYSALCNVTLTGNQREDIVNVALSQVGYKEGSATNDNSGADDGSYDNYTEYNYWYHNYVSSGMPVGGSSAPWCATFVSWCAEQANVPSSILKRSTAAGHGASYFNVNFYSGSSTLASSDDNDSYFKGYNYTPRKGDLFFTRSWSHVGLVVEVSGSYVITVEGNTNNNGSSQGNGVYKLASRKITDLYFGVPNYTNSVAHNADGRFSNYLPIGAFPLSSDHIPVYDEYGTEYSNRYIDGATDVCMIKEIYTDGWCKVTYPSSAESSGVFTAYVPLSAFISSLSPVAWTSTGDYTAYRRCDLTTEFGSGLSTVSSGASCLEVDSIGGLKQVIYPVSGKEYHLMGWIQIPKKIHTSVTSVNLTVGGMTSQTIYAWSSGYYNGNTALYYSRSNSNISCSWGDWTDDGKAPLTISANTAGTTTLTIGVKDSDSGEILDSTTVTVTVAATSYTVSYNANGGTGAPSSQSKSHGTDLTLSTTVPERFGYTFVGWSTSSSASSSSYKPGGSFTEDANTTLYAVWKAATTISSSVTNSSFTASVFFEDGYQYFTITPSATGKYRFESTGSLDARIFLYDSSGTLLTNNDDGGDNRNFLLTYQLTSGTKYYIKTDLYSGTGSYSFTVKRVYTVTYNANNGSGAPAAQEKIHGSDLTLSNTSPTRSGYTFLGWATSASATSAMYQPGATFTTDADTTLYAVWEATSTTGAKIVVDNVDTKAGETICIPVYIEGNPGVAYAKFKIAYSEALELVSAEDQGVLTGTFTASKTIDIKPYVIQWMGAADSFEDGCIVILTFKVADDADEGTYSIEITCEEACDAAYEDVTFASANVTVTVTNVLSGDVNGDGKVNGKDGVMLAQYLAEWDVEIDLNAADVNGDGKVNGKDGVLLAQYLAEWDVTLE